MLKQIVFSASLLIAFGILGYSFSRVFALFRLTKPFPVNDIGKRTWLMLKVAFWQSKILRKPVLGFLHALVFWGFCLILIGSLDMMVDGVSGLDKSLSFLGIVYTFIMACGDIFAWLILIAIGIFFIRRVFMHVKRFSGVEMKHNSHIDANIALSLIFLLMVSLILMNANYLNLNPNTPAVYPISGFIAALIQPLPASQHIFYYEFCWWSHILLVFGFMNILPYSKHFHVFMSVPNVFLSRLDPLGKLPNMDNVTKEVKIMMDPESAYATPAATDAPPERFGVKDAEDVTWKAYLDSLSCTECGRCTSACPANITGKRLSPRKVVMDLRARMKEKGRSLIKDKSFNDNKSLIRDYVTAEELWACTTCNACATECPININHPIMIMDMREISCNGRIKRPLRVKYDIYEYPE